jgi:gliding motility-associated-like protein
MVKTPTAALRNDTLLCTVRQLSLRTRGMDSARYEWKNNMGPWQSGDTTRNANADGKWYVRVSNRCGSAGDSVLLRFDSIPKVNIAWNDSLVCNLGSLQIEAEVMGLNRNIEWRHGGSSVITNVSDDGTYLIRAWNDCGETSDSVRVRFDVAPQVNLPNGEQFCDVMPERVLDGSSSTGNNVRYTWNTGESVPVLRVNNPGFYRVRASNDCGTIADSVRYIMLASPQPQLPPDTSFCGNFSYALAPLNGDPAWVYRWNDGSGASTRTVRDFGVYELEVSDTAGCKGKASTTVFNSCNTRVWVPDAFTPGISKGMNDVFKADIYETEYIEFRVFNRWGQEVFATKDPAAGWDGTFNGMPCAEGVYAWSLYYKGGYFRGSMKGTVHLLR